MYYINDINKQLSYPIATLKRSEAETHASITLKLIIYTITETPSYEISKIVDDD